MGLFAEDGVIIGHPFAPNLRAEGVTVIREVTLDDFENRYPVDGGGYSVSNVMVDGNTVTFDRVFIGQGFTCQGESQGPVMVVGENGKVVSYTFATPSNCN